MAGARRPRGERGGARHVSGDAGTAPGRWCGERWGLLCSGSVGDPATSPVPGLFGFQHCCFFFFYSWRFGGRGSPQIFTPYNIVPINLKGVVQAVLGHWGLIQEGAICHRVGGSERVWDMN